MNIRLTKLVWSAILVLGLSTLATAGAPLQDVVNAPITVKTDGSHFTLQEVQAAIVDACNTRKWVPQITGPGEITASILVRGKHHAEVTIPFDENKYSILYVSSKNLDYSEHKKRSGEVVREIHRNYIKWTHLLSQTIGAKLAAGIKQ